MQLRRHLGLDDHPVRIADIFQMLGEVEMDLVDRLGIDVLAVVPLEDRYGIPHEHHKPWRLFDGSTVLMPGTFDVEVDAQGNWLLHRQADPAGPVMAKMPKGGYYFDHAGGNDFRDDFVPPPLEQMEREWLAPIANRRLDHMARRAAELRPTNKALLLTDWVDFGPATVGTIGDWLCLLAGQPDYVDRLVRIRIEGQLRRLEKLYAAGGDNIDLLAVDGQDYGTQRSEMFSPAHFQRFYMPFYRAINGWVHTHTSWKTWKHCCGSIPNLLGMLIESGLDCINPVQTSAAGMDAATLKQRFGGDITFWGGGVDTQKTLPFGDAQQVYDEVVQRLRVFAPGGGYVFNPVHNIQAGTPVENIEAAFAAVRDHGAYPIRPG